MVDTGERQSRRASRKNGDGRVSLSRTEPGADVEVNGESVAVAADGSFTKTVQLGREGWSFVEIRARDASGNETLRRQRVFVESL